VWGCMGVGVWGRGCVGGCGGVGSPLALEHSKVCTLCDFGHLQFLLSLNCKVLIVVTKIRAVNSAEN
jgi:hypothetical protein